MVKGKDCLGLCVFFLVCVIVLKLIKLVNKMVEVDKSVIKGKLFFFCGNVCFFFFNSWVVNLV